MGLSRGDMFVLSVGVHALAFAGAMAVTLLPGEPAAPESPRFVVADLHVIGLRDEGVKTELPTAPVPQAAPALSPVETAWLRGEPPVSMLPKMATVPPPLMTRDLGQPKVVVKLPPAIATGSDGAAAGSPESSGSVVLIGTTGGPGDAPASAQAEAAIGNGSGSREVSGDSAKQESSGSSAKVAAIEPPIPMLGNKPPTYPAQSIKMGEEGVVVLTMRVEADGSVGQVRVRTSSGFTRLDESAAKAISNWRFKPAKQGGRAIAIEVDQPIPFRLGR